VVKNISKKKHAVNSVPYMHLSVISYTMACYTALIIKLRQDQSYILFVIMNAKIYKNLNLMLVALKYL